ncbi:MAG: glycogen debranching N-terminal domain-containing protein [Gemmatimonadales bacterium]
MREPHLQDGDVRGRPLAGREGSPAEVKHQVATSETPSAARSIADAVVIKRGALYFLTDASGEVPFDREHGLGLYYRDCRYLNGYRVRMGGKPAECLGASAARGFGAELALSSPRMECDGRLIPSQRISIRWERVIDDEAGALRDEIRITSHELDPVRMALTLEFRAAFEDVFVVRRLIAADPGTVQPPLWQDGDLVLGYDGKDGVHRTTRIEIVPAPDRTDGATADIILDLEHAKEQIVSVVIGVSEGPVSSDLAPEDPGGDERRQRSPGTQPVRIHDVEKMLARASSTWLQSHTAVETDSPLMNQVLRRSLLDLGVLTCSLHGHAYFAAGVPWFVTLFGRDSAISALQTLAFMPEIAADTLRVLARYQGHRDDELSEEQPGKILHELRVGEMARRGLVPHMPFYGSVDATALFLVLLAEHARWTGSLALFEELSPAVDAALRWITSLGAGGDGLIRYASRIGETSETIVNQGWKDAGDSIVDHTGRIARPPIALVEVQAYAVRACRVIADLFTRSGDGARAQDLERHAAKLERAIDERFWSDELGLYDMALEENDEPTQVIASNAGHVLFAEAARPERARRTVERLMEADMYSGWGVRTLSADEAAFNPVGYHRGTVWPHDNSLLAAGFRAYGEDDAALRLLEGLLSAAMFFQETRLPELFAGYDRTALEFPVNYPVACHPQAWAAGSVPFMLTTLLGLRPEGFEGRLRLVRPVLPDMVERVELRDLRVAGGVCDLRCFRSGGSTRVEVARAEGVEVVVEEA